jgi:hypothetical protein
LVWDQDVAGSNPVAPTNFLRLIYWAKMSSRHSRFAGGGAGLQSTAEIAGRENLFMKEAEHDQDQRE